MATPFSRTVSSLHADGFRAWTAGVVLLALVLGAWTTWAVLADVSVYEVTTSARLEVGRAAHPVEATAGGRIAAVRMAVGQRVRAGEVLVELDATPERRRIDQEQARFAGYPAQIAALRAQIAAEEQAIAGRARAAANAADEARAALAEAEAACRSLETVADRKGRLRESGLVSEVELLEARYAAEKQRAVVEARRVAVARVESEHRAEEQRDRARIANLARELTELETEMATSKATVQVVESDLQKYLVRAPVDGSVAEMATLSIGTVVGESDRLGTIVPDGELRAVAYFAPEVTLGRIRPGQRARLQLDGFPWAQYGDLEATVATVSSEVRDGRIRVELAVRPDSGPKIRLEHGMTATLEVEVERVTPATLVLRSVGRLVASPAGARDAKENT